MLSLITDAGHISCQKVFYFIISLIQGNPYLIIMIKHKSTGRSATGGKGQSQSVALETLGVIKRHEHYIVDAASAMKIPILTTIIIRKKPKIVVKEQ
jgi:hypothetical protein